MDACVVPITLVRNEKLGSHLISGAEKTCYGCTAREDVRAGTSKIVCLWSDRLSPDHNSVGVILTSTPTETGRELPCDSIVIPTTRNR